MQTNWDATQNSFRKVSEFRINTPASYRIRVIGEVDESSLKHLGRLEINTSGQGRRPITTLTGPIPDQATLFKVLEVLYDMRLPLLSIVCLEYI